MHGSFRGVTQMASHLPFASGESRRQLALAAVALLVAACALMAVGGTRLADEWVHYAQVQWFVDGNYAVVEPLTTLPGFHAIVALVLKVSGIHAFGLARGVTIAFAVVAALGFARLRRKLFPGTDALLPTLQFAFFPILFPFCFLLYTDVPSLALVLWAFSLSLDRRHLAAGAIGIAALSIRQTNVVWICFVALLQFMALRPAGAPWRERLHGAVALWPYTAAVAAFAGYWLLHGSISLSRSQARAHPDISLHTGNLFFMLFLAGVLFLPLLPAWLGRYATAARARPVLLALPLALAALYATSFRVDHPFHAILPDEFLRNGLLLWAIRYHGSFAAFGAVAVAAACALTQVRWQRPSFALLLPVSALFVSASWLIEQRYYLIPFALLQAFRAPEDRRAERLLLAAWMPLALWLLWGTLTNRFFL